MGPGSHGSTFGGNPLATYVGNAVLDILLKKNFLKDVRKKGVYFRNRLEELKKKHPKIIKEVRGRGLLIGLKISVNQIKFIDTLIGLNLLTARAAENVIRLLPPLNVSKKEIDLAVTSLDKACKKYK